MATSCGFESHRPHQNSRAISFGKCPWQMTHNGNQVLPTWRPHPRDHCLGGPCGGELVRGRLSWRPLTLKSCCSQRLNVGSLIKFHFEPCHHSFLLFRRCSSHAACG